MALQGSPGPAQDLAGLFKSAKSLYLTPSIQVTQVLSMPKIFHHLLDRFASCALQDGPRLIECPELKGTHRDHLVQLLVANAHAKAGSSKPWKAVTLYTSGQTQFLQFDLPKFQSSKGACSEQIQFSIKTGASLLLCHL